MIPLTRDLVLVGGGHAHALVLRRWGMDPLPGARLTLIDPGPVTAYTGMLPGHVAGHYTREEIEIDLVRLARFAGARLILGPAPGIDTEARTVAVLGRPPVAYDVLSLDVGVTSAPSVAGYREYAYPVKPFGPFAEAWSGFSGTGGPACVIGGGVAGCELALAMAEGSGGPVTVIERDVVLQGVSRSARKAIRAAMDRYGVEIIEGAEVQAVEARAVRLSDRTVASEFTAGAAGATPWAWLTDTPLETRDGYIAVGPDLASLSHPEIFAAGDCAALTHAPRPKAGVYAVRAAPILHDNLCAALAGGTRRNYRPQKSYLKLVSLGEQRAVADRGSLSFGGPLLWRLKDRIDRRFMDKLTDLPSMAPTVPATVATGVREELSGTAMLCAGCGSKVGRAALNGALEGLPGRDDIEAGPGDDAAILRVGGVRQVLTTDHLRSLWDDPYLMARIAAVHAMGDVWSMGAAPQAALLSLTLPRMSERLQSRTLTEILAGMREVLELDGAAIAGGHTTMGAEMQMGLTVTGLATDPVRLSGARVGDALILTKPIGSGTIMAAAMRGMATGREVESALASMSQPQSEEAQALRGAHAMTDVTGFGLAGHLLAMCQASGVGAEVDTEAASFLRGAERLAAAGVRSSAWAANRADSVGVQVPDTPRGALMFDPQTAGGLLAAVEDPAGFDVVGRIVEGSDVVFR